MIALRSTLAGRITLTVCSTLILLFLALPIVLIVVTSFGEDAFGSFPPDAWTLDWYTALHGLRILIEDDACVTKRGEVARDSQ